MNQKPLNKETIEDLQGVISALAESLARTNMLMQDLEKIWGLTFTCEFTSHEIRNSETVSHKIILRPSIDITLP